MLCKPKCKHACLCTQLYFIYFCIGIYNHDASYIIYKQNSIIPKLDIVMLQQFRK